MSFAMGIYSRRSAFSYLPPARTAIDLSGAENALLSRLGYDEYIDEGDVDDDYYEDDDVVDDDMSRMSKSVMLINTRPRSRIDGQHIMVHIQLYILTHKCSLSFWSHVFVNS